MSPRRRAQLIRVAQYIVFAAAILVVVFAADWYQLGRAFFRPEMLMRTITNVSMWAPGDPASGKPPTMIPGLPLAFFNTIAYSIGGFTFGLVLGTVLALMKLSNVGPYRWVGLIYTEIFRGLPALVVLLIMGNLSLGFPGFLIKPDPYGTIWLGLGLVYAAFMSETIRAGIQAVPKGQVEAARTLGMTSTQTTRYIVFPQAFRIILPPLTNELISMVKDSSLVYILGLAAGAFDLTKYGRDLTNTHANLSPLMLAGLVYLLITVPLSFLVSRMESRGKAKEVHV